MKITIKDSRLSDAAKDNIHIAPGADVELNIDDKTTISRAGRHNISAGLEEPPVQTPSNNRSDSPHGKWHEGAIGKLGLSLAGGLLIAGALWAISYYLS